MGAKWQLFFANPVSVCYASLFLAVIFAGLLLHLSRRSGMGLCNVQRWWAQKSSSSTRQPPLLVERYRRVRSLCELACVDALGFPFSWRSHWL